MRQDVHLPEFYEDAPSEKYKIVSLTVTSKSVLSGIARHFHQNTCFIIVLVSPFNLLVQSLRQETITEPNLG